ncbi:MAG: hypothetical protein P1U69_10500 [Parvibaculaceae bacterium]|nr:hypothetical protein [Parvibaculaceae bacterium]|tara:strand:+ start:745 stop:1674 length:930 start_codon:yes stop_codon:yes gene_type:complete
MTTAENEMFEQVAAELDADVLLINADIFPNLDADLVKMVCSRSRRSNVIVVLVTSGGLPDVAYRVGRCLQENYAHLTIVIAGWCKSAGTIMCAGADVLAFGVHGELGPIDVQLRREDEIGERDSGLSVESAFESLQGASFKLFENCMLDIKDHSFGAITFKTAAEIASNMAVGMVAPIFAQLDPIKIGEIHRSVRIAEEYARRLAARSGNLNPNAINMLLRGYPDHGFVIDKLESKLLFRKVVEIDGKLKDLVDKLGNRAIIPTNEAVGGKGILEFLNHEQKTNQSKTPSRKSTAKSRTPSKKRAIRKK